MDWLRDVVRWVVESCEAIALGFAGFVGWAFVAFGILTLFARDAEDRWAPHWTPGMFAAGALILMWSRDLLVDTPRLVATGVCVFVFLIYHLIDRVPRPPPLSAYETRLQTEKDEEGKSDGWLSEDMPPTLRSEGQNRVGLVLEGGGAKGAYAFGCIRTLHEAGVRFDAVAGTSVGALNALLLATEEMDFGARYWGSVSHRKVHRLRLVGIALFPLLAFRAVLYGLGQLYGLRRPRFAKIAGVAVGALLSILGGFLLSLVYEFIGREPVMSLGTAGWIITGAAISLSPLAVISLVDHLKLSLLVPNPLREQVTRIAARADESCIPVYVTTTEQVPLVDPDHISAISEDRGTHAQSPEDEFHPLPRYLRLDDLPPCQRADAVMASAALPVGIFPPIQVEETSLTDGGEVDNLPIYPLVSMFPCDILVVVRLSPAGTKDPEIQRYALTSPWRISDRSFRLRALDPQQARELVHEAYGDELDNKHTINYPPRVFPEVPPRKWPEHVITIAPERKLGGFLRGTMNFSPGRTREWIEQGAHDAEAALPQLKALLDA